MRGQQASCPDLNTDDHRQCLFSIPIDALVRLMPFLQAAALRHLGGCNGHFLFAIENTPVEYQRARALLRWVACGGGAYVVEHDAEVAAGAGGWHPGGVAVADLPLTTDLDVSFRYVLETVNLRGDLLFGMTRCEEDIGEEQYQKALATGYGYIMGRELAPASILFGGGSLRCCFSGGDERGPRIDYGPNRGVQKGGRLARLRHAGDWVSFHVSGGRVHAEDFRGQVFEWGARLQAGEVWRPTVAWTGSKAYVRVVRCSGPEPKRALAAFG